jgi:4-amino-4-deoxy-L-arabinose transferase-like glycosyltransferase
LNLRRLDIVSTYALLARWGIPVGLFLLALAVRLPALGQFLTADEFLWVDRSRNFLAGLLNPAYVCMSPVNHTGFEQAVGLACTLRTGHPGVTTMWTGSLGILLRYLADGSPGPLFDYVLSVQTNPLDPHFIAPTRLPTVVLTSLWVAAMYWLVWRLFADRRVALAAGLLLALDPFHVALSRVIHHDALATTFMSLSLLMALIYWGQRESRRWLVASGAMAGFAFLSKSPAFFLNPFIALVGLWSLADRRVRGEVVTWRHLAATVGDGLLWFGCAATVFVAFWPAMWVIPVDALRTIFFVGSKYASGGHAKGNYFLGTVSRDPGVLFYPVTWLLRSSPLTWLGLVVTFILSLRRWRAGRLEDRKTGRYVLLMLLYVILFVAFMTMGEKKQDRYILPIYPILNIIAAIGLVQISNTCTARRRKCLKRLRRIWAQVLQLSNLQSLTPNLQSLLFLVILFFQGTLIVANYPYYLTYYNPLLGGIRGAQRMVTIGWGEGLDLAAAYLNQKPNAGQLRVSSWYQSTFAPFFKGEAISYSQEKGKAMAGDYVVFYINQLQRRFPDDELFRYFESRYQPEKIIPLKGVNYVEIYPGPHIQHYVEDRVDENRRAYQGIAALLGWDWPGAADPNRPAVAGGGILPFRLYWEYLGKAPEEQFFFRLVGPDDQTWAEGVSRPALSENGDPATWRQGQIITEAGELTVPPGTPPGEYRLQIGFYTQAPAVTEGELTFDLPPDEAWVQVTPATQPLSPAGLPLSRRWDTPLAELRLLGTESLGTPLVPDKPWRAAVYWQAEVAPKIDYRARLSLVDGDGQTRWVWDAGPLVSFYPTSRWGAREVVRSQVTVTPTLRTPGGTFDLALTLLDGAGRTVGQATLGAVPVRGRIRSFSLPPVDVPLGATFGDAIELVGFNLQYPKGTLSPLASPPARPACTCRRGTLARVAEPGRAGGSRQPWSRLGPRTGRAGGQATPNLHPGDEVAVTLIWRVLAPVDADYTATVQLLGADGRVYGQQDALPLDGAAPTSTWSPGEVLTDTYRFAVATEAPPGEYRLIVGMYRLEMGERLALTSGMDEGDAAMLTRMKVDSGRVDEKK